MGEEEEDRCELKPYNDEDEWAEIEILIHEALSNFNRQVEEEKKKKEEEEALRNGAGDNLKKPLFAKEYEMCISGYTVDNNALADNGSDNSDIDEGSRMDYNLPDSLFSDDETFFWAPLDVNIELPNRLFNVEETSLAENEKPTESSSTYNGRRGSEDIIPTLLPRLLIFYFIGFIFLVFLLCLDY